MRNWPGLAALVLAMGVAICVIALAVGTATQSGPISQEDATLLSTVLGAAVGAVATYLGTHAHDGEPNGTPLANGPEGASTDETTG